MLALTGGLVVAAVLIPVWYWDRGLIEIEALEFIQQYLDDRNVVRKVFDPYANDLDTYQARELSYFLDYLDARFFHLLIARGHVLFVPASSIAALVLTIVVFLRGARQYQALPPLTRMLLLLVYFSNYIHLVTMGMFYRSSKPMLAPLLIATTFYVLWLMTDGAARAQPRRRAPLLVFTLFCLMSLLDRQGFFYSLLGLMVLGCHAALARGRRDLVLAAGVAVATMTVYNVLFAPAIVQLVNGYRPSLEFQRLPLADLATTPSYFTRAGELLAETSARLLGDVPPAFCLGVLGVLAVVVILKWKGPMRSAGVPRTSPPESRSWSGRSAGLVCLLVVLAHVVMFAVMIARHPPLWEHYDHRLWYYPLPFQAFLITVLLAALSFISTDWKPSRLTALNVVLAAVVIANVVRWDDNVRLQRQSGWFTTVHTESYVLKRSLSDGRAYSTHAGYLPFYHYCLQLSPPLQARAERIGAQN